MANTYTLEELDELRNFDENQNKEPSATEAFFRGAVNPFNLAPKAVGATEAVLNVKPEYADQDAWDQLSFSEKYDLLKDESDQNFREAREAHPVADFVGSMAGSALIPSGAGIGANIAGRLGAKATGKFIGSLAGNAVDSALSSAGFAENGTEAESAGIGAGIGAGLGLGGKALGKLLSSGKLASKYVSRLPEMEGMAQKESAVSKLERKVKNKIEADKPKRENDAINFTDKLQKNISESINEGQVLDDDLIDTMRSLKKELQKTVSEESSLAWDTLSTKNDISVKPYIDKLKVERAKLHESNPNAPRIDKWINTLEQYGDNNISEVELKKLIGAIWDDIAETDLVKSQRGIYSSLSSRVLTKLAGDARDELVTRNKEYAKIVEPLGKKVKAIQEVEKGLGLDKDDAYLSKKLKLKDKTVKDSLDQFRDLTGIDVKPQIEKVRAYQESTKIPIKSNEDLVELISNSGSDNTKFKEFKNKLAQYDAVHGTKFSDDLDSFRNKYLVDLLAKAEDYIKQGSKGGSKLTKNAYNVLALSPYTKQSGIRGVLNRIGSSDTKKQQTNLLAQHRSAKNMIKDLADYTGQDSNQLIRDIQNENLYDLMGSGKANGSRRVQLGANIGEGVNDKIKNIPFLGKAWGATVGALIDSGVLQRTRRELLDRMYQLEKNPRNVLKPTANWESKVASRVLAPEMTSSIMEEQRQKEAWDQLTQPLNTTTSIQNKREQNEEYFGRSG